MEYNAKKRKFTLAEQEKIGNELKAKKAKCEADKNDPSINKSVWSENKKKRVHPFTQTGYINPFVREFFVDWKNEKSDFMEFKSAAKFVTRCLDKIERGDFSIEGNNSKTKFRLLGAGLPKRAIAVRLALFDYFIDVRSSLKGRLPRFILMTKAQELYRAYCDLKKKAGENPDELKLSDRWLAG